MDVLDAVVIISAFVFATCCGFIQVDNGWHHHSDYCSGDILQDFECSFNNCPSSHATIGFHGSDFYCSLSKVKLFFCLPGSGRLNKSSVVPLCKSNRPVKPKPARNIGSSTRWRAGSLQKGQEWCFYYNPRVVVKLCWQSRWFVVGKNCELWMMQVMMPPIHGNETVSRDCM